MGYTSDGWVVRQPPDMKYMAWDLLRGRARLLYIEGGASSSEMGVETNGAIRARV